MNLNSTFYFKASRLDIFAKQLLDNSGTGENDYLLIDPYSIGDVIHSLSLINEFRSQYCKRNQKINLICNHRAVPVAKLFKNIDNVVGMDCDAHHFHFAALADRYNLCAPGIPIIITPDIYSRGWLGRLFVANKINIIEGKRLILELALDKDPQMAAFDSDQYQISKQKAIQQGLKENSIIIFNHATTARRAHSDSFLGAKEIYGDNVYYDATKNERSAIEWAKPLNIALEDVPYFATYAGAAISIRSGITDLLSMSKAKLLTIYPNAAGLTYPIDERREMSKAFMNYSLENLRLGNFRNETVLQYLDDDSVESVRQRVLDALRLF